MRERSAHLRPISYGSRNATPRDCSRRSRRSRRDGHRRRGAGISDARATCSATRTDYTELLNDGRAASVRTHFLRATGVARADHRRTGVACTSKDPLRKTNERLNRTLERPPREAVFLSRHHASKKKPRLFGQGFVSATCGWGRGMASTGNP